jgi:diacylglycerol kinase family enzyme
LARSVDVVFNLNAKQLRKQSGLREALARLARRFEARVHETQSLDDLDRVASELVGRGTEAVVLAGGDGSCMEGVSALLRAHRGAALPPIAFAPAGTVGTIARNVTGRPVSAEHVIREVCLGNARSVPWATLRVEDGSDRKRVGFIFGGGLVQHFFEIYDSSARGVGVATAIAARAFAGSFFGSKFTRDMLEPVPCKLTVDGQAQAPASYTLIVASVVRDVGLGLRVTYRAGDQPGRFHVVASGLPAGELAPQVPRVLAGQPLRGHPHIDVLAESMRVDFQGNGGGYVLDGELFRTTWTSLTSGPTVTLLAVR